MKTKFFLLAILILLTFSLAFNKTTINNFPLFGKLVILDPGHGGLDPGATYGDKYEKEYNLVFANTLKTELEKTGATVILTREGDYDLASSDTNHRKKNDFDNRIKLINDSNANLYISLHMNFLNDSSYYGSQVFFTENNTQNKKVAEILQKNLNSFFNFNKETKIIDDSIYMYKKIDIPGVLIEYGFISSTKDRNNLKDENYRINLSKVIIKSTIEYFT